MSHEEIDRLIQERSLARVAFDDAHVTGYWTKAVTSFRDAQLPGLSADGALQHVYTAGLQATFAVLAAADLRVKSTAGHYKAFYAMQKLGDQRLRSVAIQLDELRVTRHESVYEPAESADVAGRLTEASHAMRTALGIMREWLVARRPSLEHHLTSHLGR